ncbi:MAG TPA: GDP-mannose 4,6-dehydratase [Flavobacteriales bacterium]|nr:GDP-mannose 4,6-dehydratase [Flavobacteriales bacterium]
MAKHAIITGGAGFIGSHLVDRLMAEGTWRVTVVDNFHPNYPRAIKEANVAHHLQTPGFTLVEGDVLDEAVWDRVLAMAPARDTIIVHLAALVGVRPSIADAMGYHQVNVRGTLQVLERARHAGVPHFVLASSSSVYGEHPDMPWQEDLQHLQPVSPYAVTKLAAEEFTRVYARLHGLNATVLRFFTVYGPRQRPDLAIHDFFNRIQEGRPIRRYGDGSTLRDYTFVDDIIAGVRNAMAKMMEEPPGKGAFEIYNLGHSEPVALNALIAALEQEGGRKALIEPWPEQPGDVPRTYACVDKARIRLGYEPTTGLAEGLRAFARWHARAKDFV